MFMSVPFTHRVNTKSSTLLYLVGCVTCWVNKQSSIKDFSGIVLGGKRFCNQLMLGKLKSPNTITFDFLCARQMSRIWSKILSVLTVELLGGLYTQPTTKRKELLIVMLHQTESQSVSHKCVEIDKSTAFRDSCTYSNTPPPRLQFAWCTLSVRKTV